MRKHARTHVYAQDMNSDLSFTLVCPSVTIQMFLHRGLVKPDREVRVKCIEGSCASAAAPSWTVLHARTSVRARGPVQRLGRRVAPQLHRRGYTGSEESPRHGVVTLPE